MRPTKLSIALAALFATAFLPAKDANAVRLDPEAGGQALIYLYYTVRSYGTDAFNTYLSIVNTSADGKALKVRFREGRAGLSTLSFNLFLSPNDTWTAALVPSDDGGTQLITGDASCVSPALAQVRGGVHGASFSNAQFSTDTVDRAREGYAEVIEMATLTGPTLAAIAQDASGVPHNCAAIQGATFVPPAGDMAPPSGGLQGTLTLINVASGMDFTVNADALADFRKATAYSLPPAIVPDLSAADPVSVIATPDATYRLDWSNGNDAASSLFMHDAVVNEYILDSATSSSSDWILTFPTRVGYVTSSAQAPFSNTFTAGTDCESFSFTYFNREAFGPSTPGVQFPEPPPPGIPPVICYATTVLGLTVDSRRPTVFGSANGTANPFSFSSVFQNGWGKLAFTGTGPTQGLVSLPSSSRIDARTGAVTTGSMRIRGLPVTGFMARTFLNGLLACSGGTCQGAYGSAFPHPSSRSISPP